MADRTTIDGNIDTVYSSRSGQSDKIDAAEVNPVLKSITISYQNIDGIGTNVVTATGSSEAGAAQDSGMMMLSDGSLLLPENVGVESSSIAFGDLVTLHERNSFMGLSNAQFPDVRFDIIDARTRRTTASERPRQFYLTEAENDFTIQGTDTAVITTNPLTVTYTATLDSQSNAFKFRVDTEMTNVRVRVRYATGNQTVIKYLPTKRAWETGSGGMTLPVGEQVIEFPDSPLRTFVNDQIEVTVQADNVALEGTTSPSEFPYLVAVIQRGEFRDVAWFQDVRTLEEFQDTVAAMFTGGTHNGISVTYDDTNGFIDLDVTGTTPPVTTNASVHNFAISTITSPVNLNTLLNGNQTISFSTTNTSDITALTLTGLGDDVSLTVPSNDGTHTQTVLIANANTASATTFNAQIRGTTTGGQTITSNSVSIVVRDQQSSELAYYGVRATNDFATTDLANLSSVDVTPPGQTYTISGSWPTGETVGILEPANRAVSSIIETAFNTETYPDRWDVQTSARTINSQAYNLLTIVNNGPTGTYEFRVTHA